MRGNACTNPPRLPPALPRPTPPYPMSPVADSQPPHTATCPCSCLSFVITPSSPSASNMVRPLDAACLSCSPHSLHLPATPGKELQPSPPQVHQSCRATRRHKSGPTAKMQQSQSGWKEGSPPRVIEQRFWGEDRRGGKNKWRR